MVFTSSSTHSDGKSLSVRLLDPYPRAEEILPCATGARRPRISPLRRRLTRIHEADDRSAPPFLFSRKRQP
jgi:hypothetical protein